MSICLFLGGVVLALVGCHADLKIDSLTRQPATASSGQHVIFTAVVKNEGWRSAPPTTLGIRVGNEINQAEYLVPGLGAGGTHTVRRISTLPAGAYQVTATADLYRAIRESSECNNQTIDVFPVR